MFRSFTIALGTLTLWLENPIADIPSPTKVLAGGAAVLIAGTSLVIAFVIGGLMLVRFFRKKKDNPDDKP